MKQRAPWSRGCTAGCPGREHGWESLGSPSYESARLGPCSDDNTELVQLSSTLRIKVGQFGKLRRVPNLPRAGPIDNRPQVANLPYLKRKCPPCGEHLRVPALRRAMYMGESDSTVSQPPKPVCDWILGCVGNDVKEKSLTCGFSAKLLFTRSLRHFTKRSQLWKSCLKRVVASAVFRLTGRIVEA